MIEMEKVFKIKNNLKNLQFNSVEPTPRSNVYACVIMKYYSQSPVWKLFNARAFDLGCSGKPTLNLVPRLFVLTLAERYERQNEEPGYEVGQLSPITLQ